MLNKLTAVFNVFPVLLLKLCPDMVKVLWIHVLVQVLIMKSGQSAYKKSPSVIEKTILYFTLL